MTAIRIATRASDLALVQARYVANRIDRELGASTEIVPLKTTGDRVQGVSLAEIGGKGLFVKEIDEALLDGRADLAVHSAKDLPAVLAEGLELAAFPRRADCRDALIAGESGVTLGSLRPGARIGTGSARRAAQLKSYRSDLEIVPLRGNVFTRLKKLEEQDLNGVILACAGLDRLGLDDRIEERISTDLVLPAIAQGALAIAVCSGAALSSDLAALNDPQTACAVSAERQFGLGPAIGRAQAAAAPAIAVIALVDADDAFRNPGEHPHCAGLVDPLCDTAQPGEHAISGAGRALATIGRDIDPGRRGLLVPDGRLGQDFAIRVDSGDLQDHHRRQFPGRQITPLGACLQVARLAQLLQKILEGEPLGAADLKGPDDLALADGPLDSRMKAMTSSRVGKGRSERLLAMFGNAVRFRASRPPVSLDAAALVGLLGGLGGLLGAAFLAPPCFDGFFCLALTAWAANSATASSRVMRSGSEPLGSEAFSLPCFTKGP